MFFLMRGNLLSRALSAAASFARGPECQGHLEEIRGVRLRGWAWSPSRPDEKLVVEFVCARRSIGEATAALFRPDLKQAGIGDGNHGFEFELPRELLDGREHVIHARFKHSGVELDHSPRLLRPSCLGALDEPAGVTLTGWAWDPYHPEAALEIEIEVDGRVESVLTAADMRPDLKQAGIGDGRHGFHFDLPLRLLDGRLHEVRARVAASGFELEHSPRQFQLAFEGHLDGVFEGEVHGWIWNRTHPHSRLAVDIWVDQEFVATASEFEYRADLAQAGKGDGVAAFRVKLPAWTQDSPGFVVSAKLSGSDLHLPGSPKGFADAGALRQEMEAWHAALNAWRQGGTGKEIELARLTPHAADYLRRSVLPEAVRNIPPSGWFAISEGPAAEASENPFPDAAGEEPVDVVVPVYRGQAETLRCLESLAAAPVSAPCEVTVLIDDSESEAYEEVIQAARQYGFTVMLNRRNLGFVQTANRAFRLHPRRDVVLLNSDTVVHGDWLGRLRRAAYSHPAIGTVTPLSNNATIVSYPHPDHPAPLPSPQELAELDSLCERLNGGATPDVPSAVGFCMYVRRDCLAEVGLFDERNWDRGYAEENDFCWRARALGWRNIAAPNVFVGHSGSASFGAESAGLIRKNLARLAQRYPEYEGVVMEFLRRDPLLPWRRNLDAERLASDKRPVALHVSGRLEGGSRRNVLELSQALEAEGWASLLLETVDGKRVALTALDDRSFPNLIYKIKEEWQDLLSLLRRLNLSFVHLHHAGHPALSRLPRELGKPYYLTVHDYSWICPQTTLMDESGVYCGEPPVEGCEKCLRLNGSHPLLAGWFPDGGGSVAELRRASAELAVGASRVICPSRDTLERMRRHFPGARLEAQPHPEITPVQKESLAAPPGDRLRVALIGAIGPHKGFEILVACARYAWERRIPIDFAVIGHVCRPQELRGLPNVSITGPYKESEVFERIREQRVSIAFFPALWPETYSFALSVALAAGLFPVAFDMGAIAERIRETGYGHLVRFTRDPAECVAALLEAARHAGEPPPKAIGAAYASILRDYYGSPVIAAPC